MLKILVKIEGLFSNELMNTEGIVETDLQVNEIKVRRNYLHFQ